MPPKNLIEDDAHRWGIERFVGRSEALTRILSSIRRLQNFPAIGVLITGESGTGKELAARAIHHGTPGRANGGARPFIAVNCAAVQGELVESVFFGRPRDAGGISADRAGLFERANGGTLFLDEVEGLPPAVQTKFLRVLEDGLVAPPGFADPRHVDVRVIASSSADLQALMTAGTFRRELYFRLAQFTLQMPPLRERSTDIALLAEHFIKAFAPNLGSRTPRLTTQAQAALEAHAFPGNVRELKNMIERALIESGGRDIEPAHLQIPVAVAPQAKGALSPGAEQTELPLNLAQAESLLIERALAQTGGNVARAARLLGINRSRIYRKFNQRT